MILTSEGVRAPSARRPGGEGESLPGANPVPIFDPTLTLRPLKTGSVVTQIVLSGHLSLYHDLVLPEKVTPISWNCHVRRFRECQWHTLAPPARPGQTFATSVDGTSLRLRGLLPAPGDSESGEVAWRWWIESAPRHAPARSSKRSREGCEMLVRLVVKVRPSQEMKD